MAAFGACGAERIAVQAVADRHAAELAQAEPGDAAAGPSPPQPGDVHASPAERPSGASAASTSSSQRELLQQTQAANRVIPAEGPVSPIPPDGTAYEGGDFFVAPEQPLPGVELQLDDIVRREDIDSAMEQNPAGERPAAAMQVMRVLHLRLVKLSGLQPGQNKSLKGQITSPLHVQAGCGLLANETVLDVYRAILVYKSGHAATCRMRVKGMMRGT